MATTATARVTTRPTGPTAPVVGLLGRVKDFGVPVAVLGIVIALITPVPPLLLDLLIVTDIMLSLVVLMVAVYLRKPVEFSSFPTLLLLLTLFRLSLNISSTRLILMNGSTGTAAAGRVVEAFGSFLVGGSYIIGTVIFLVMIAIQYVVINHGAVRISEVTARFTLDALPGKQMSIDSDLNTGLIDETEARRRRKELAGEAEFYGAMDGASRFTQRDAVASILITGINIIAGFLIGVLQHGMDLRRALQTYTVLTIGDGLVTVIPALMISISGGLIVTRTSSDDRVGEDVQRQLFTNAQPLLLAGGVLLLIALLPGIPAWPFLSIGLLVGGLGLRRDRAAVPAPSASAPPRPTGQAESLETLLRVEPLAIELGLGLVKYVAGNQDSAIMRRTAAIRKHLAGELGLLLGPVRVTDNPRLKSNEYVILLRGVAIERYELPSGCELAISSAGTTPPAGGVETREPSFGMLAWWVPADQAEKARRDGFTVADPVSVLGAHLTETVRRYAHELLSRQDMKRILDRVSTEHPKVVDELVPKIMSLATVHRVFQNLLRERVSIRDAVVILEALGDAGPTARNPVLLTEYVRGVLRRSIIKQFVNRNGELPAYLTSPQFEQVLEQGIQHGETMSHLALSPSVLRDLLQRLEHKIGKPQNPVAVVTGTAVRCFLRQIAEGDFYNVWFIGANEIPPGTRILSLGMIE